MAVLFSFLVLFRFSWRLFAFFLLLEVVRIDLAYCGPSLYLILEQLRLGWPLCWMPSYNKKAVSLVLHLSAVSEIETFL